MSHHLFRSPEYPFLLVVGSGIGFLLWVLVFIIIIRQGYRSKIVGMPLVGISTTITQCFIYSFVGPWARPGLFVHNEYSATFFVVWVWRVWFVLQATVLAQYFLYHRNAPSEFNVPPLRNRPWIAAGVLILLNIIGQWTFVTFYHDEDLNQSDPATYAILAGSWVLLALARPGAEGLSRSVAWMKAIGTTLIFTCTLSNPARSFGALTLVQRQGDAEQQALTLLRSLPPSQQSIEQTQKQLATLGFTIVPGQPGTVFRPDVGAIDLLGGSADRPLWQFAPATAMEILKKHAVSLAGLDAARDELESIGFRTIEQDIIYRPDVGEVDVIPGGDETGAYWQWLRVPPGGLVVAADGTLRVHYEFPLFAIVTGVTLDWVYVAVVMRRSRRVAPGREAAMA